MNNALALASVTGMLKDMLENGLARGDVMSNGGDAPVSALPPNRAPSSVGERPQLNLFLYLVTPHTGLRSSGSDSGAPRLALDLHYLVTAYGVQDYQAEILLGLALQLLHEQPVLESKEIREAIASLSTTRDGRFVPPALAALTASDLANQVERDQDRSRIPKLRGDVQTPVGASGPLPSVGGLQSLGSADRRRPKPRSATERAAAEVMV